MSEIHNFDQRWVRHTPEGFTLANSHAALCDACGDRYRCSTLAGLDFITHTRGITTKVQICPSFMPVIAFADRTGLDGVFNTFRRGEGWFKRVRAGTRVRLFANDLEEFVGEGRVTERHCAPLGELLETHASFNHMLIGGNYHDAEARLLKILISLYGKNYARPDQPFSVIYVETD